MDKLGIHNTRPESDHSVHGGESEGDGRFDKLGSSDRGEEVLGIIEVDDGEMDSGALNVFLGVTGEEGLLGGGGKRWRGRTKAAEEMGKVVENPRLNAIALGH